MPSRSRIGSRERLSCHQAHLAFRPCPATCPLRLAPCSGSRAPGRSSLLFSYAERGHRCAASAPAGGPYNRRDFAGGRPRGTPSQPDSGGKERFGQHHCHRAAKLKNLTRNPPFFETSPPPRAVIAFQPIPRAFLTLMTRNENLRDDRNPRKSR